MQSVLIPFLFRVVYMKVNTGMKNEISARMDKEVLRSISKLITNSDFRLVIGHVLCLTGIENKVMDDNQARMCFLEGRRSVGLDVARYFDALTSGVNTLAGFEARQKIIAEYKQEELRILLNLERGINNNG